MRKPGEIYSGRGKSKCKKWDENILGMFAKQQGKWSTAREMETGRR